MPQRITSFLVVFLLMFPGKFFAQAPGKYLKNINTLSIWNSPRPFEPKFSEKNFLLIPACGAKKASFQPVNMPTVSTYPQGLGMICRAELKLDRVSPVPFRFRLGSLDYVNWMERKPHAIKPQ